MPHSTLRLHRRLLSEASGQDLLEYALLTALVGIVSIAAWALIENRLGASYVAFDGKTQAIWEPPNPAATP
jgi:Flp pilus assembly pilin Flp